MFMTEAYISDRQQTEAKVSFLVLYQESEMEVIYSA